MRWHSVGTILVAAFILTGCRAFVDADSYVVRAHQDLPSPPADKALVVFLWPDQRHKSVNVPLYQDRVLFGALRAQTYFLYQVSPGKYRFATGIGQSERTNEEVGLTVHAGQTYYLRFDPAGVWRPHRLEQIGQDTALAQLQDLKQLHLLRTPREEFIPITPDSREEPAANESH